jgi:hypothetical protein
MQRIAQSASALTAGRPAIEVPMCRERFNVRLAEDLRIPAGVEHGTECQRPATGLQRAAGSSTGS